MNKDEVLIKFFQLSVEKQREVLMNLLDYEWSDEIANDLETLINES